MLCNSMAPHVYQHPRSSMSSFKMKLLSHIVFVRHSLGVRSTTLRAIPWCCKSPCYSILFHCIPPYSMILHEFLFMYVFEQDWISGWPSWDLLAPPPDPLLVLTLLFIPAHRLCSDYALFHNGPYYSMPSALFCVSPRDSIFQAIPCHACHAIPRYSLVPCYSKLFHVTPHCFRLFHMVSSYSMLFHDIPCYSMWTPWCSMLSHSTPCYSRLFNTILRYSMLSQAIPCDSLLFHAILHYSMWFPHSKE